MSTDADAAPGARLRIWDRVDDDLVEREVSGDASVCRSLSGRRAELPELFWIVRPTPRHSAALRLSEDAAGTRLLPTREEAEQRAREAAEARVAELEAELARLRAETR